MIIKAKIDHRTKYYKWTSAGKPILGSKGDAARFPPEQAKTILEQLKTIDARFAEAELVDG